jgi:site-specific DNA-methyltransferase (adenine-specific)
MSKIEIEMGYNLDKPPKCEICQDSMQNYKKYAIPPAQLILADVPYIIGTNFYGSSVAGYNGGERGDEITLN